MICSNLSQLEILTYCLDLFSLYTTYCDLLWEDQIWTFYKIVSVFNPVIFSSHLNI